MSLPGFRAWVFSAKAFVAACLALYIACWIDLPRPYWAVTTVYVVMHPFAGPTLSKALYRLSGTVLGGIGAVLLVPNLSSSRELTVVALGLWTAVFLYLSLMDRRPHNYIFMLAGYSAPIIGFPSVDAPGDIFMTAIARVQEIGLGIICASVVGALVMPHPITALFGTRVEAWLRHLGGWAQEALDHPGQASSEASRGRLAADVIEIDMLAAQLGFDPASPGPARRWAEMLRLRMLLLLPITSSIASRIRALRPDGLTAEARLALQGVQHWLRNGADAAGAAALRPHIAAASPALGQGASWNALLQANLMARLRELVDLQSDCLILVRHIRRPSGRLVLAAPDIDGARGAHARHVDRGLALRSALAAFAAIVAGSAFWILTAWPEGSSLPVMAAVACSFFAPFDNPVGPQMAFAKWASLAVVVSGAYLFAVLPLAHEYETLMLLLAPVFLVSGLIAANPSTAIIGLAVGTLVPTLVTLQTRYSADFASFANNGLATVGGLWCGALVTALARVVQPHWVAARLTRSIWRRLAEAAEQRGRGNRAVFASLLMDQAGQLVPRLAAGRGWADMLAAIRIGLNVVALRRARHHLPPAMLAQLDAVFDGLAAEFHTRAGSHRFAARRLSLGLLDQALGAAVLLPPGATRDDVLQGLVGIRLGLFPDADGYGAAAPAAVPVLDYAA
jgi:uncharacterized membrane protein YccC